jgi:hypothetical protein
VDVGDPDVEEGGDAVGVGRGFQDDGGFVVGGAAADVDDDPAVGEGDDAGFAGHDQLAAQDVDVEPAGPGDVGRDDEVGERDALGRHGEVGHGGAPIGVGRLAPHR